MVTHKTSVAAFGCIAAALLLSVPQSATAAVVDAFAGAPTLATTRTDTLAQAGWGFYTDNPSTTVVNQLGFWVSPDNPGGVLAIDHLVSLYFYNGSNYTKLAEATITAGSSGDANQYAWAAIPTISLPFIAAGADYYLVTASVGTDIWGPNTGSATVPTLNSSFGTRTQNGLFSGTAAPGVGGTSSFAGTPGNGGYFGPNIGYLEAAVVPAPAAMSAGLVMLMGVVSRRRR